MSQGKSTAQRVRIWIPARARTYILITTALLILPILSGCGPSAAALEAVDYAPLDDGEWEISTPEAQGLAPELVADLYYQAGRLETLYSLLIVKNGQLIAEDYFNEGSVDQQSMVASVAKSYVSALVGIAFEQGCLTSLDQKLLEFFPEYVDQIRDPRKEQITLRQLLQMRSGYPWEETHPDLFAAMFVGNNPPLIVDFPLTADPGTTFQYSNTTSAWLAAIVSRACETDLKTYMETNLLEPIGSGMGEIYPNMYDDYHPVFNFSARDMAKFGLLYLNDGVYDGVQVVPAAWVEESLAVYSEDAWTIRIGRNWKDIGYGYQWWSARAGAHEFDYAWGHGGQLIVLSDEYEMVIVTKADPFWQQHDDESWRHERATLNLVADFIASLPAE